MLRLDTEDGFKGAGICDASGDIYAVFLGKMLRLNSNSSMEDFELDHCIFLICLHPTGVDNLAK